MWKNFKKIDGIVLGIIFVIGLILRFAYFETRPNLDGDYARDMLVSKQMAVEEGFKKVAPSADGGKNDLLNNTPIYYWTLAILWKIMRTEGGVSTLYTLLGCLNVLIAFDVGTKIADKKVGFLISFWVAIGNIFVFTSRILWQPFLVNTYMLLSIWWWAQGKKSGKVEHYMASALMLFLGANTHLSMLPFAAALILISTADIIKMKKVEVINYVLMLIILAFVFNLISIEGENAAGLASGLWIKVTSRLSPRLVVDGVSKAADMWFSHLWHINNIWLRALAGAAVLGGVVLTLRSKDKGLIKNLIWVSLLSLLFTSLYPGQLYLHYIMPYYVLSVIILAVIVRNIDNSVVKSIIVLVISIVLVRGNLVFLTKRPSNRINYDVLTQTIVKENKLKFGSDENYGIDYYNSECDCGNWEANSIWYSMEEAFGQTMTKIDNSYYNLSPKAAQINRWYYICPAGDKCNNYDLGANLLTKINQGDFKADIFIVDRNIDYF